MFCYMGHESIDHDMTKHVTERKANVEKLRKLSTFFYKSNF